ncbi:MAG: RluA family pseudouridine synthase [Pontixanthobacter sp.]
MPAPPPITGTITGTLTGTLANTGRIDKSLAQAAGLSRERIKALIALGAVTIGRTVATNPSVKMQAGAHFTIQLPPVEPAEAQPQDIPLDIVFEDAHLIVVNKPAGMVVHPAAGNTDGTLVNALLYHCTRNGGVGLSGIGGVARPGIVHRIDKGTSGLLVVAKSAIAHEGLASQFADHSITRRYLAVCNGHLEPAQGTVEGRIGRSEKNRKKMAVLPADTTRGKHAVTHYRTIEKGNHCSVLECILETGRTHQIRVHCASIGHALTGDPVYGSTPAALRLTLARIGFARQALHAAKLGFIHPASGQYAEYQSDLPSDMQELIDQTVR